MHETALSLPVVLPEAVLALGTLLLVLYGALRGERAYDAEAEALVVHCDGWTFVTGAAVRNTFNVQRHRRSRRTSSPGRSVQDVASCNPGCWPIGRSPIWRSECLFS